MAGRAGESGDGDGGDDGAPPGAGAATLAAVTTDPLAQLRRMLDGLPPADDATDRAARSRVEGAILALTAAEGHDRATTREAARVLAAVLAAVLAGVLAAIERGSWRATHVWSRRWRAPWPPYLSIVRDSKRR